MTVRPHANGFECIDEQHTTPAVHGDRGMRLLFRFVVAALAALSLAAILYIAVASVYTRHFVDYDFSLVGWPRQSEFGAPVEWKPDTPQRVRILSVQGGGLLGLADLEILKAMEERSGKRVHELFDFVSGTSTGAIISTLLLYPDPDSGLPMTAHEAAAQYQALGGKILDASLMHRILTGNGLFGPRLTNHARVTASQEIFRDARFRELLRPAMYPSFSQNESGLKLFRNWDRTEANLYLSALVSAVTSAPTYFPAIRLTGDDAGDDFISDAALILNAPGEFAYLHARTHVPDATEFVVVSLGTKWDFSVSDETSIYGGILQWVEPLLAMIFRGESSVSRQALERHGTFQSDIDLIAVHMAPVFPVTVSGFDASEDQIDQILRAGRAYVRDNAQQIDDVVALLTASKPD